MSSNNSYDRNEFISWTVLHSDFNFCLNKFNKTCFLAVRLKEDKKDPRPDFCCFWYFWSWTQWFLWILYKSAYSTVLWFYRFYLIFPTHLFMLSCIIFVLCIPTLLILIFHGQKHLFLFLMHQKISPHTHAFYELQ